MKTWQFHVSCPKWSRLVPQFSLHRIKGSWGCAILSSWSLDGTETRRKMKLNWKDGKAPKTRLPGRSGLLERCQTSWFCATWCQHVMQKEKGSLLQCTYLWTSLNFLLPSLYLRGNWENPTKIGWMRKKFWNHTLVPSSYWWENGRSEWRGGLLISCLSSPKEIPVSLLSY